MNAFTHKPQRTKADSLRVSLEIDGRTWREIPVLPGSEYASVFYRPKNSMERLSLPWNATPLRPGSTLEDLKAKRLGHEEYGEAFYEISEGRITVETCIPRLPEECSYLAIPPGWNQEAEEREWGLFVWESTIESENVDYFMAPEGSTHVLYSKDEGSSLWRAQASSPSREALEHYLQMLRTFVLQETYETCHESSSEGVFEGLALSFYRKAFHRIVAIEGGKVERPSRLFS